MSFNLADLIDVERTQQLLENFLNAVGVPAAIIGLEGTVLVSSPWQRVCTDFHRHNEFTCRRCIESDTILANDLLEGKTFSLYRCLNGLTDAASPIIIEGKHLANAFIGQFFIEKPDLEFFRAQAKEFGFDQSAYLDAVSEVPIVAEETLPSILAFLTSFAEMTASLGLRQLRQLETEKELREARIRLERQNEKLLASEQDLHHSRDELETRVRERTVELIETNRRLEAEVRNRQKIEEIVRARNQMLHAMAGAVSRQEYLEDRCQANPGMECVPLCGNSTSQRKRSHSIRIVYRIQQRILGIGERNHSGEGFLCLYSRGDGKTRSSGFTPYDRQRLLSMRGYGVLCRESNRPRIIPVQGCLHLFRVSIARRNPHTLRRRNFRSYSPGRYKTLHDTRSAG